jgi:hypothetical protein
MGIFDFLGDLSSKRSKELGLGGLQSLLGTRGAAQAGAIGDEMMQITGQDSLPGYFNEQTREYVPWYVDLFDGGGLNAAGGQAQEEAARSGTAGVTPGGAPIAQPGLLANNQLSDMERANRNRASQMTPSLGSQLSDMEMANRNRAGVSLLSPDAIYSARLDEANRGAANAIANQKDPRLSMQSTGYGRSATVTDFLNKKTDLGAAGYGPMGQSMSTPRPRESTLNTLRENAYSVGPIDAYRNALNNRPDIPLTQPFAGRDDTPRLSDMQSPMMQHPAFPKFVDILKRSANERVLQDPRLMQETFNNYLRLEGL